MCGCGCVEPILTETSFDVKWNRTDSEISFEGKSTYSHSLLWRISVQILIFPLLTTFSFIQIPLFFLFFHSLFSLFDHIFSIFEYFFQPSLIIRK